MTNTLKMIKYTKIIKYTKNDKKNFLEELIPFCITITITPSLPYNKY